MIKKTYALFDTTAEIFLNSLVFHNDGDAIRWAQTQVDGDRTQNMVAKYPHQFILFRLQDFNDKTGQYIPRDKEKLDLQGKEPAPQDSVPKEILILSTLTREEPLHSLSELKELLMQPQNKEAIN